KSVLSTNRDFWLSLIINSSLLRLGGDSRRRPLYGNPRPLLRPFARLVAEGAFGHQYTLRM
ncbi:hypothetical protein V1962_32435, partial [Pseudomonas aeruginosa]